MQRKFFFILSNILIIILTFGLAFFSYSDLPPEVPLWYSRPWGETQLAPKMFIFLIPLISLLIFGANLIIPDLIRFEKIEENERKVIFIKDCLVFVSLVISLINLITVFKIAGLFL